MNRRQLLCSTALLAWSCEAHSAAPVDAARKAASEWLSMVDSGDFNGSWERAASSFKRAVTAQQWTQASMSVRGPLGGVKSRREKAAQETKTLPGAPDGQYVVIQLETVFEQKSAAVETVIMALDTDGAWRVTGYFVR
jgi:hypothetical protein